MEWPGGACYPDFNPASPTFHGRARQGKNDFGRIGYGGPAPPGKPHRYFFKLYALSAELNLPAGAAQKPLEAAMLGRIAAEVTPMGTYRR